MATEIVRWCDVHLARDERVPVEAAHHVNAGDGERVVELCAGCESEYWQPFADFVTTFGVRAKDAGKPVARRATDAAPRVATGTGGSGAGRPLEDERVYVCWVCSERVTGAYPFKRHTRDVHGFGLPSEMAGDTCPICGASTKARSASMASHAQAHLDILGGDTSVSGVFLAAIRLGDPHGVVAARLDEVRKREGVLNAA